MRTLPKALATFPILAWIAFTAVGLSSTVLADTQILADSAPPPARIENVPHRDGYVWASGHWAWHGHSWAWIDGSYLVEQRHAHWIPDGWEPHGTQWQYVPGHWQR